MLDETRNTRVVAFLILAITAGAVTLRWLEPPARGWSPETLLMAERGGAIADLAIEYVGYDQPYDPAEYDGVLSNGACDWHQRGPHVRLAVIGSRSGRLDEDQTLALLSVLGSLNQARALDLSQVRLDPNSDASLNPQLPAEARELRDLLVRKGIIP